jgi:uncharacterized membrane protein YebE (DUF533 family)
MEKLMSKKVLMGAGLVLVAYLVYKAYAKKQAEKAMAEAEETKAQQSAKPAR